MSFLTAPFLVLVLAGATDAQMPSDFLKVDSKAWSAWLDDEVDVGSWGAIPLRDVLADEFGPAAFAVDDPKALDRPITLNVSGLTRRAALWRLSQRYHFTLRWAQKHEPRVFLGLSEAKKRTHQVGGVTLTAVTQVMRSDYRTYETLKREGRVTKEQRIGGTLYYAIDVDRDLNFGDMSAHVNEVQRFKTTPPPGKRPFVAQFIAKVTWIEAVGKRKAKVVPIGVDSRWLVGIDVLSIEKPGGTFAKKGAVVLAIHSPVRAFGEDREHIPGKIYQFNVSGTMSAGRPSYHTVETREKKEATVSPL
ncbi:MAG: hypothetical protein JW818_20275 [Pirellulales bacterium]|nr:hypothetical protein [Pirellulales bacterium]